MTNSTVATNANTIFDIPCEQIHMIHIKAKSDKSFQIFIKKTNNQISDIPNSFDNLKNIILNWNLIVFEFVDVDDIQTGTVQKLSDLQWDLCMECRDASLSSSILGFWNHYFDLMKIEFFPFFWTLRPEYCCDEFKSVEQFEQFYNANSYCIAMRIRGCDRYLVRTNHEYVIVDRDPYTNTWHSGDYLGHHNFKKALKTLKSWEK